MKAILALCTIIALALGISAAWWFFAPDRYGVQIAANQSVPLIEVLENPDTYIEKPITIEGFVSRQCAATGCFFFFAVGDRSLRVELSDIAPTFPQRKGYRATVTGTLKRHNEALVFYGTGVEFSRR